jgi:hypothetical protein
VQGGLSLHAAAELTTPASAPPTTIASPSATTTATTVPPPSTHPAVEAKVAVSALREHAHIAVLIGHRAKASRFWAFVGVSAS